LITAGGGFLDDRYDPDVQASPASAGVAGPARREVRGLLVALPDLRSGDRRARARGGS
jgi:hypothetical protein